MSYKTQCGSVEVKHIYYKMGFDGDLKKIISVLNSLIFVQILLKGILLFKVFLKYFLKQKSNDSVNAIFYNTTIMGINIMIK